MASGDAAKGGDQPQQEKVICLFDVDGTLTKSRQSITPDMEAFLLNLRSKVTVGLVGGSDLSKIAEQMGTRSDDGAENDLLAKFEYVFAENGLVAHIGGMLQENESILSYMGERKLQTLINFCLRYMSDLELPCKRGNFIEFRTGLINICPIGRSCSQTEREQFTEYDRRHGIRAKFAEALNARFANDEFRLKAVIGGQISIDVFPWGWDKTYCLKYVQAFDKVYFFGDKTFPGGNDYEIYEDARTIGYTVDGPQHTKEVVSQIFF